MQRIHLVFTGALAVAVVVLGVLLGSQSPAWGAPPVPAATLTMDDEAAVRGLVSVYEKTWNSHDMKGMHDVDTEDVHWINVSGNHWRGKATVYKGHDVGHQTILAKSTVSVEKLEIRLITPDVAVAVATMKFAMPPVGSLPADLRTRGSFVCVKREGNWKIVHFHNTTINEDHEKNDPATKDAESFLRDLK